MKTSIKNLFLVAVGTIIGSLIGGGAVLYFTRATLKTGTEMLALNFSAWEAEEAYYQYRTGNADLARYALEHAAGIFGAFDRFNDEHNHQVTPAAADLAFTYIRLGILAENNGNVKTANEYFDKALENYRKYCLQNSIDREYTAESLKNMVNKIDTKGEVSRRPFASVLFMNQK
jgi:tetratricopeptide (TPR) repeat protein